MLHTCIPRALDRYKEALKRVQEAFEETSAQIDKEWTDLKKHVLQKEKEEK